MEDINIKGLLGSAEFKTQIDDIKFNGRNIVLGKRKHFEVKRRFFGDKIIKGSRYVGFYPEKHFLSIAGTRQGKGTTLIIPNLLNYKGSAIVIDPKGENAYITAPRRREIGQNVIILDPWNEVNRRYGSKTGELEEIATFNPLSSLDIESDNYEDDLAYLTDSLIINQGYDAHWDDSARSLVAGLIDYVIRNEPDNASLPYIRILLCRSNEDIAKLARFVCNSLPEDCIAVRRLGQFTDPKNRENSSIISTARRQTTIFDSKVLSRSMSVSSFSFESLVRGPTTIYLVLPVDKLETYGRWLRIMVSIAIKTVSRCTERLDPKVLFFLDEFGTIGRLAAVAQAVGLMAGMNMCIWAFLQDLNQLRRDYRDEWETFIGNSTAITSYSAMDQTTSEYISNMLGKKTITVNSESENVGFLVYPNRNVSTQARERQLLLPNEIRHLSDDTGIVLSSAYDTKVKKIYYFKDNEFSMHARSDPYHSNGHLDEPLDEPYSFSF